MKYIQGNLIDLFKQGEFDLIGHQCNCFSTMGSGIAFSLCQNWPAILEAEKALVQEPLHKFGKILPVQVTEGIIVNMYSQVRLGSCWDTGIDSFLIRSAALEQCLTQINNDFPNKSIGLPLLASGLAADLNRKGSMSDLDYFIINIESIVTRCLRNMKVTIVYL